MVRFHVEIVQPSPLLPEETGPVSDAHEAFERIWEMIPKNRPKRLWGFFPEMGLFIKGRTAEVSLSRKNYVRSRRIATEITALAGFRSRGLPVPEVVAWGTERTMGITTRAFLMLRLFDNVIDFERYLLDDPDSDRPGRRSAVFPVVGRLIRQLHDAGCVHRDLSDRNILVHLDGDEPTVRLIDCPHGRFGIPAASMQRARREDLFRITRSVLRAGATDAEVTAMLEAAAVDDAPAAIRVARESLESGVDRSFSRRLWQLTGR
jgi:tRNA A-37 threonylcarbamoyl transferase component Bud32